MHLKRQKVPKSWPVPRKGTKYVVRPKHDIERGIPVLIILRDMLKLAQNRKETKRAINEKKILINNKSIKDEKNNVLLFDTITIVPTKKYYKLVLSKKGKFDFEEINEAESTKKIAKIIDKKTLKGKKRQLNLSDGRNFLSDIKCNVNDSVLINLKEKKIEKCLALKEKANVFVFAGKYAGKKGIINKIDKEKKILELSTSGKKINVLIKHMMIVE